MSVQRVGSRGEAPGQIWDFTQFQGLEDADLVTIFWSKNHRIMESSRSICGLIGFSYRRDNLVLGRFIGTS